MSESSSIIEELFEECRRQSMNPPVVNGAEDKYISFFANALSESLEANVECQDVLGRAIVVKQRTRPFSANLAFNSLLRLFQMEHMRQVDYPFDSESDWKEGVKLLLEDRSQVNELALNMILFNVGSDVETRIAGPKLVANFLQAERTNNEEDPFRVLSIGSARDHSLAMLSANIDIPTIMVVNKPEHENEINQKANMEIMIGDCYGVDLWPIRDELWSSFLESCRYYPSELKDETKREMYAQLEKIRENDPRLHHIDIDFGSIDASLIVEQGLIVGLEHEEVFDQVIFSTCMYQNYSDKQKIMFDNALKLCREGGKIIIQDFMSLRPISNIDDPIEQLNFLGPNSTSYSYITAVYDKSNPADGLTEFAKWNNGRCEKIITGDLINKILED